MRRVGKKLNLMSPIKLTGVITLLASLFFLAGAAGATVLYDNLGSGSDCPYPIADYGPLYDSFSTGTGGFNLARVELLVLGPASDTPTPWTGWFSVGLYSDSNNSPGSLLTSLGTVYDNALDSTNPLVVTFDLPSLAAGARYWVGLTSNNSTSFWEESYESGAGVDGEYWGDNTGVYGNYNEYGSTGPMQMRVSGDCAVPLPPSVWLLGSGLVGLIGFRKFRRS